MLSLSQRAPRVWGVCQPFPGGDQNTPWCLRRISVSVLGQSGAQRAVYVHCQPGGPDHCQVLKNMLRKKCACNPGWNDRQARHEYEERARERWTPALPGRARLPESVGEAPTPRSEGPQQPKEDAGVQGAAGTALGNKRKSAADLSVGVPSQNWMTGLKKGHATGSELLSTASSRGKSSVGAKGGSQGSSSVQKML